jgi:hypothetical protein
VSPRSHSVARLRVSRALLESVDQMSAEFPSVPLVVIYARVGEARVEAAKQLPNVSAYREVLEEKVRLELRLEATRQREVIAEYSLPQDSPTRRRAVASVAVQPPA